MKTWKKATALLLALIMVMGLTACGGGEKKEESKGSESKTESKAEESKSEAGKSEESKSEESKAEESKAEEGAMKLDENSLYLITDKGTIDDRSFNQGSFEGLDKAAKEFGLKEAKYLRPAGEGDQIYLQAIDQAIKAGAKVVVTPGFLFEVAVGQAQEANPDVKFILVDAEPKVGKEYKTGPNTVAILFKEEQSGFLAGYAAVKDGYTKLGFMGGIAVPAVIRYGFGFVAGANYAAKEMGIKVDIKYNYTGSFTPKPEIQTMAASWYTNGTEVIFSCGGGIASSVLKAAQENNGKMIGVDVDQSGLGEQVITSAMKNVTGAVYNEAKAAIEGKFEGGKVLHLGVQENGVGLPQDFSRFKTFNKEAYDKIYKELVDNKDGVTDSIPVIDSSLKQDEQADPTLIKGMDSVNLEYVK